MRIYENLIDRRASEIINKQIPRIIMELQTIKVLLSGDDSPLENTWDEICVQIQHEKFVLWEPYQWTIESVIMDCISELSHEDLCCVWLQTNEGFDYYSSSNDGEATYCEQDILDHLCNLLLARADDWTNARIRAYLEMCSL